MSWKKRYRQLNERPDQFRLDINHTLANGLAFAGLGAMAGSTLYADSSVYGRHGTIVGAQHLYMSGVQRNALYFSANPNYVSLSNTADVLDGVSTLTIAGWVNTTDQLLQGSPAWINNGHTTPFDIILGSYGRTTTVFIAGSSRSGPVTSPAHGVWGHRCITWDGSMIRIYLNGVLLDSDAYSTAIPATSNLIRIGQKANGTDRQFYGYMADNMIWVGRALSLPEIQQLADPSNVMLSGLILPPARKWWPVVSGGAPSGFLPAWIRSRSQVIGGGVT